MSKKSQNKEPQIVSKEFLTEQEMFSWLKECNDAGLQIVCFGWIHTIDEHGDFESIRLRYSVDPEHFYARAVHKDVATLTTEELRAELAKREANI